MYERFAAWYDALTENVDYPARAAYFERVIARHRRTQGLLLLDLGCGTGTLSLLLAQSGWEVVGVDASADMLAMAVAKAAELEGENRPMFLCQPMEELDLFGTMDVCVCALDSINHVLERETLREVFRRLSLFLETDGLLIFDANTPYKHERVLGDETFVYERDGVMCVWQNERAGGNVVDIRLDFFEHEGGNRYRRYTDVFSERAYTMEEFVEAAKEFELLAAYGADTFEPAKADDERVVYVMRNTVRHQTGEEEAGWGN